MLRKDLLLPYKVKLTKLELDEGEKLPKNLKKFDAFFCMGDSMKYLMEKELPGLII